MALADLLADGLEFALSSPENTVLVATLLIGGWHVRKAAVVGNYLSMAGVGVILVAVAMLFGVIEIDLSVLIEAAGAALAAVS